MRWLASMAVVFGLATLGLWLWERTRPRPEAGPPIVSGSLDVLTHRVDSEMEAASREHDGGRVPSITLEGSDGASYDLSAMTRDTPALLIFIKDECPCSTAAERYFARLHAAYGKRVSFLGIIDGGREVAARWVRQHGTPFPVAHDPSLASMRALGATNSAFVAVVAPGGTVETLWPGFSRGMLSELSARLASLAEVATRSIDTSDAPGELYTGCPFELDTASAVE